MGHRDIQIAQIYAEYAPSVHEVAQVNAVFTSTQEGSVDGPRSQAPFLPA